MRKLLIALTLAGVGLLMAAGLAFADAGPHGGYTSTTDACAGCHRAHTGQDAKLLKVQATNLCLSCHDGTGSKLDVYDGAHLSATLASRASGGQPTGIDGALRGGGFVYARIDSGNLTTPGMALANTVAGVNVTSAHIKNATLNGLSTGSTMWGNGASGAGTAWTLQCYDCHDPHGTGTYRILREVPNGSGVSGAGISLTDETTKTYTTANYWNTYQETGTSPTWQEPWSAAQMAGWCSQCHTRYLANGSAAETSSGDAIFTYRHLSDGSGTIAAGTDSTYAGNTYAVFCLQCHVSHGSDATMGTNSQAVPWPGGTARGNESTMLKIDSRGTCFACHGTP